MGTRRTGTGMARQGRGRATALAATAVLAVGATACGGFGGDDGSASSERAAPTEQVVEAPSSGAAVTVGASGAVAGASGAFDAAAEADGALSATATTAVATGAGAGPGGEAVPALQPIDIGRSIIFTATVAVEVDSVATASGSAMNAIAGVGGYLFGQQSSNDPTPSSVLTFKVDPSRFQEALVALGSLGTVVEQQVSSDDVTEAVVDLQSRIAAAQTSVERLRGFLAEATDVNSLAALERELLARESQLEQLNGQLRTVQAQVDLATITLTLTQAAPDGPALEVVVTAYPGADDAVSACPGTDELELREGETVTVCYEVRNTGDGVLRDVRVDDPGMDLSRGALRVVQGDADAPFAPGAVLVLAGSTEAAVDAVTAPRVRAVAVDAVGEPRRVEVQMSVARASLLVAEDTSRPGFLDALGAGGRGLLTLLSMALLAVGVALPFVWVLPLGYGLVRLWRRRRAQRAATVPAGTVLAGTVPAGTVPSAPAAAGTVPDPTGTVPGPGDPVSVGATAGGAPASGPAGGPGQTGS
ncbi:MAG: DUF4349 domain-containing protein [Acidimicrobiia bacterium]